VSKTETSHQKPDINVLQDRVIWAYEYLVYAYYQSTHKKVEVDQLYRYFQTILSGNLNLISADTNKDQI
jgi:hypothetical protein